jgi:hypothetical protein
VLAALGLANKAEGRGGCKTSGKHCRHDSECCSGYCRYFDTDKNNLAFCA